MKRIFWMGVGVGVTIVVIRKARQLRERYSPPAIVHRAIDDIGTRAESLGTRLSAGAREFGPDLRAAMAAREAELRGALLSEGQTNPDVTRASRAARSVDKEEAEIRARFAVDSDSISRAQAATAEREFPGRNTRVDDEDGLPYSF